MQNELKELFELIEKNEYEKAGDIANKLTAKELTVLFNQLSQNSLSKLCQYVNSNLVAEVLPLLEKDLQEDVIDSLQDDELEKVMDEISIEDTVEIIDEMPQDVVRRLAETEEILSLLAERKFSVLSPILSSMNAIDLAEVFEKLSKSADMPLLFRILPKDLAADTFVEMDSDIQQELIQKLNDKELKAVMDELFLDDAVDFLEEMPASVVKRVLAQSDKATRAYINELLKYPKDSAGSIMTIEFVALHPMMTVEQAFERIRKTAIDKETIYTCYVTGESKKLIGLVTAKDLMLAEKSAKIQDIMNENVIYAHTEEDKEDVAGKISDYGFLALPIVDREKRLVGIVTVDDAMTVIEEENTEDIAKMSGITPDDKPYLKTNIWKICLNRLPWLLILLVSATFTGLIISANESTLNMPVYGIILTACMPMLMGTGGNAGSQASAMIIRGLALKEVKFSDFWKVVWKEFRVSLLLGILLSIACFLKLLAIDRLYAYDGGLMVALVVCISLFATVLIAKLIGAILPLLAQKCHLDPAVVASPFITTIVDVLSLTIYCAFAVSMLGVL